MFKHALPRRSAFHSKSFGFRSQRRKSHLLEEHWFRSKRSLIESKFWTISWTARIQAFPSDSSLQLRCLRVLWIARLFWIQTASEEQIHCKLIDRSAMSSHTDKFLLRILWCPPELVVISKQPSVLPRSEAISWVRSLDLVCFSDRKASNSFHSKV